MKFFLFTFSILMGCFPVFSQSNVWDVYIDEYEAGPGSTTLNMEVASFAPLAKYPYLLKLEFRTDDCGSDGFPNESGFNNLRSLEDRLEKIFGKRANLLVGTFMYQCTRTNFVYLSDTTSIRKKLVSAYQDQTIRIELVEDAEWKSYFETLYPRPGMLEFMQNQRLMIQIREAGDPLERERKVEHWAFFPNEKSRGSFQSFVLAQGFSVEDVWQDEVEASANPFAIRISKIDLPDLADFTDQTTMLRLKASEFLGSYDGWETPVLVLKEK